jgi:hypothetical protein
MKILPKDLRNYGTWIGKLVVNNGMSRKFFYSSPITNNFGERLISGWNVFGKCNSTPPCFSLFATVLLVYVIEDNFSKIITTVDFVVEFLHLNLIHRLSKT